MLKNSLGFIYIYVCVYIYIWVKKKRKTIVQELRESRGGRPGPSGFCGHKAILNHASALVTACP